MNGDHYVYWLGEDGNVWVNQNGQTRNIGKAIMRNGQWNGNPESEMISLHANGTRIANPNPSNTGQGSAGGGGGGGYSTSNTYNAQLAAERARQNQRAGEASNIKNAMMGRRGEFESILNEILGNIDRTYKEESNRRKETYDADSAELLSTLEKALPEIASSFAAIGGYDSGHHAVAALRAMHRLGGTRCVFARRGVARVGHHLAGAGGRCCGISAAPSAHDADRP